NIQQKRTKGTKGNRRGEDNAYFKFTPELSALIPVRVIREIIGPHFLPLSRFSNSRALAALTLSLRISTVRFRDPITFMIEHLSLLAEASKPGIAEWIQIVLVAVTAIGVSYSAWQASISFKALKGSAEQTTLAAQQSRDELRRFRHEQGISVLREWAQFTSGL